MAQEGFEAFFHQKIFDALSGYINVTHENVFNKLRQQASYKRLRRTGEDQYFDAPTEHSIETESAKSKLAFAKISLLVVNIFSDIDRLIQEEIQCDTFKEAVLKAVLEVSSEQKFSCGVSIPASKSPVKQKKNEEKVVQETFEDLSKYCAQNLNDIQKQASEVPGEEVESNTPKKSKDTFPDVSKRRGKKELDNDDNDAHSISFESVSSVHTSDLSSFDDEIILTSDEETGTEGRKLHLKEVKDKLEQANDKKLEKTEDDIQDENKAEDDKSTQSQNSLNDHESSNVSQKSQRKRKPNLKYAADDILTPSKKEKASTVPSSAHSVCSDVPQKRRKQSLQ